MGSAQRLDIFKGVARTVSDMAPGVLGVEQDVVLVPTLHDTPGELSMPLGVTDWKKGECEPIPGRTMPSIHVVERDYRDIYKKFTSLGPLLDKQGNLWAALATQGVSVRQAGGSWQHFTPADGLVMPGVQVLAGDAAGSVWIGTSGAGISVLDHGGTLGDKGDDTWTTYAAGVALPSGYIRALAVDRWGQLWVGSFGAGASVKSDVQFSRALLPYVEKVGP